MATIEKVTLKQFEKLTNWKPATIRKMLHEYVHEGKDLVIHGVLRWEKIGRDWFLSVDKKNLKKV